MKRIAAPLVLILQSGMALAQQPMFHTVYLAMMLENGVPTQMSAGVTLDACQR